MTPPESSSATAAQNVDVRARLLSLINANWTTQAVSVATQLRLPELLRDGPRTADSWSRALWFVRLSVRSAALGASKLRAAARSPTT